MAQKENQSIHNIKSTVDGQTISQQLFDEYKIKSVNDIRDAFKDLLSSTINIMMKIEMDDYLGYEKSEQTNFSGPRNYRSGNRPKRINTNYGSITISIPQDRQSMFEPQIVKKYQTNISNIDQKILFLYIKGLPFSQFSEILKAIYGFNSSDYLITDITDNLLPEIEEWQNRSLDYVYQIVFIDTIYSSIKRNGIIKNFKAYAILGLNSTGQKDVLTIEMDKGENFRYWLSILNDLKKRGVKNILIICKSPLNGIKEASSVAFPQTKILENWEN